MLYIRSLLYDRSLLTYVRSFLTSNTWENRNTLEILRWDAYASGERTTLVICRDMKTDTDIDIDIDTDIDNQLSCSLLAYIHTL